MDGRKQIKDFVIQICDWVMEQGEIKEDVKLSYNLWNDRLSFLIADKGIEKRIEKRLFKKYGLKSEVEYMQYPSLNKYGDGEIKIKIIHDEHMPSKTYKIAKDDGQHIVLEEIKPGENKENNDFEKQYPGFEVTCKKCGSKEVYVDNHLGWSDESGAWGSVDLVCNSCGNRIDIAEIDER